MAVSRYDLFLVDRKLQRVDLQRILFLSGLNTLCLLYLTFKIKQNIHKYMDRKRLTLRIVEKRTAAAVDLGKACMEPPVFVLKLSDFSCIPRVIADHGECAIIKIRDDDPAEFTLFRGLIAVQLKYLDIIIIKVDRIEIAAAQAYRDEPILIISVGKDRGNAKKFRCLLSCAGRKGFSHCKDHLDRPSRRVIAASFHIVAQSLNRAGVGDQDLDPIPLYAVKDRFHALIAHIGYIDHEQVILEGVPSADGILSLDPRAELASLHSEPEAVQLHNGHEIHIYVGHLVPIGKHGERCTCRAAR